MLAISRHIIFKLADMVMLFDQVAKDFPRTIEATIYLSWYTNSHLTFKNDVETVTLLSKFAQDLALRILFVHH